jgi:hypothetical protein
MRTEYIAAALCVLLLRPEDNATCCSWSLVVGAAGMGRGSVYYIAGGDLSLALSSSSFSSLDAYVHGCGCGCGCCLHGRETGLCPEY